jgi:outer membrane protein
LPPQIKKLKDVKNLSIVLNVILSVAVIVLYILHFSGKPGSADIAGAGAGTVSPSEFSIAYVNSDSLLTNYDFFKDLEKKFMDKRDKLNAEYQNRAEGLQREIGNFQSTAGNMTISQARAVEEDLRKKQQNLMMYQEQLGQQLMQEEASMNSDLYERVAEYLQKHGKNKNLQIVLTYTKGSGVLYANDSLDITKEVIVGLNETYQQEKDGGSKAAKPAEAKTDSTTTN